MNNYNNNNNFNYNYQIDQQQQQQQSSRPGHIPNPNANFTSYQNIQNPWGFPNVNPHFQQVPPPPLPPGPPPQLIDTYNNYQYYYNNNEKHINSSSSSNNSLPIPPSTNTNFEQNNSNFQQYDNAKTPTQPKTIKKKRWDVDDRVEINSQTQQQTQQQLKTATPATKPYEAPPGTELKKEEAKTEKEGKKSLIMVGKRRGGRALPTGVVKKTRPEEENAGQGSSTAWSQYMSEVRRYKEKTCEEDRKNRPLVK